MSRAWMAGMVLTLVAAGCSEPELVRKMEAQGASYLTTGKIVVEGSEADYGPIRIEIAEPVEIQKVWDTIFLSRPYQVWFASGYRRVEFYRFQNDQTPLLTLYVNASGASHIDGASKRHRCPGLDEMLMGWLADEYERRQQQPTPGPR